MLCEGKAAGLDPGVIMLLGSGLAPVMLERRDGRCDQMAGAVVPVDGGLAL
jgi:hypothetical protein